MMNDDETKMNNYKYVELLTNKTKGAIMNDINEIKENLIKQSAEYSSAITKTLCTIGNKIAEKEGYKSLLGIDAVQYYLMQKHHWLPSQVKSMSLEDLSFCFEEENID